MKFLILLVPLFAISAASDSSEPFEIQQLRRNILLPHGRIVGGVDTDIKEVPYQVALEYKGSHFCGGTIISENYILTAAHCIIASASEIKVRVGSSKRGSGGTLLSLSSIQTHPRYNSKVFDYDAALLQVSSKVPLSDASKPVPVADEEPEANSQFRVSGWGMTREDGQVSPTLKSVMIPIITRTRCQQMYSAYRLTITSRMICAYLLGKDSCQGDSGGPAVVNGKIGGIVSWGVGCARPNFPGVYTNVADSNVRSFIRTYAKV